jgi:hypothetical protein
MVIPPGAHLEGKLENTSVSRKKVTADVTFTLLTVGGKSHRIQTQRVRVVARKRKDIKTLLNALNTIIGAGIGVGLGAASNDDRLLQYGLVQGARSSLMVKSAVHTTVILSHDVQI